MANKKQNRDNQEHEREDRLRLVAAARLAGHDQRTIARQLKVSQPTISRDFATLDRRYREEAARDMSALKGQQLERAEKLLTAHWHDATNNRNIYATDRVLDILKREADLLGLDAPKRSENTLTVRFVQQLTQTFLNVFSEVNDLPDPSARRQAFGAGLGRVRTRLCGEHP